MLLAAYNNQIMHYMSGYCYHSSYWQYQIWIICSKLKEFNITKLMFFYETKVTYHNDNPSWGFTQISVVRQFDVDREFG